VKQKYLPKFKRTCTYFITVHVYGIVRFCNSVLFS